VGIDICGGTTTIGFVVIIIEVSVVGEGFKAAVGEREASTAEGGLFKSETTKSDVQGRIERERSGRGTCDDEREDDDARMYVHYWGREVSAVNRSTGVRSEKRIATLETLQTTSRFLIYWFRPERRNSRTLCSETSGESQNFKPFHCITGIIDYQLTMRNNAPRITMYDVFMPWKLLKVSTHQVHSECGETTSKECIGR
jgi:hypothetical protein